MQPSLSHLANIDQRFLEPDASLVVMCESTVADLDDVRLVLNGLSAIFDCAAGMNAGLCQAGATARPIDLPPTPWPRCCACWEKSSSPPPTTPPWALCSTSAQICSPAAP